MSNPCAPREQGEWLEKWNPKHHTMTEQGLRCTNGPPSVPSHLTLHNKHTHTHSLTHTHMPHVHLRRHFSSDPTRWFSTASQYGGPPSPRSPRRTRPERRRRARMEAIDPLVECESQTVVQPLACRWKDHSTVSKKQWLWKI